jgi:iron-sulfur cluster assembly protein
MFRRFYSSVIKPPVIISNNAWGKIRDIIKNSNNDYGFLFYASSGGCNGFNYKLELLDEDTHNELEDSSIKPNMIFDYENNKVYIDPKTEMFLLGTKIDYIKEDYSKNIFESKFIFIPDKEFATSCGCGVSFNPK